MKEQLEREEGLQEGKESGFNRDIPIRISLLPFDRWMDLSVIMIIIFRFDELVRSIGGLFLFKCSNIFYISIYFTFLCDRIVKRLKCFFFSLYTFALQYSTSLLNVIFF